MSVAGAKSGAPGLSLDVLYGLERIREARLLPGGAGIVFVVSRSVDDVETFEVRRVGLDGSGMHTIAGGLGLCAGVAPSPDGMCLALITLHDNLPQLCLMDLTNGAMRPVTTLPQGVGSPPAWSPCGGWLAFTAAGEERKPGGPYAAIQTDHLFYRMDGFGYFSRVAQDIHLIRPDGSDLKRLTHGPNSHHGLKWSPVAGRLELCFIVPLELTAMTPCNSLGIINIDGAVRWVVERERKPIRGYGFSGDGEQLLVVRERPDAVPGAPTWFEAINLADNTRVFRAAGAARAGTSLSNVVLFTSMSVNVGGPIAPSGTIHAFVTSERAGCSAVHRIALVGEDELVAVTPTDTGCFLLDANAAYVLYLHSDHNRPGDLRLVGTDGRGDVRITALNDDVLARHSLPSVHHLAFAAEDGTPLEAWLIYPPHAEGPVPTLLEIHGGPECAWGHGFYQWAQALAAQGIATLLPNPRGSTGYGDSFAGAVQGSFARPADSDVLAAVDEAVRCGLADPDRLAVAGISYGGYLTSWLLGHTDRFKAAIPEQLISNLISMYGTGEFGRELIRSRFGVGPADGFATLWAHSPLAHAAKATTPTLIIQCEDDLRTPIGEAEQLFVALLDAGCEAQLLRIPGSGHGGPQLSGISALSRARDEPALAWLMERIGEKESAA